MRPGKRQSHGQPLLAQPDGDAPSNAQRDAHLDSDGEPDGDRHSDAATNAQRDADGDAPSDDDRHSDAATIAGPKSDPQPDTASIADRSPNFAANRRSAVVDPHVCCYG